MDRRKKSILNAVFALFQVGITSVFGLILGRSVLSYYGSDYNGINSIATQLVNTIMVLEGGFTLASNVALFKPFMDRNISKIDGILSATRKKLLGVSIVSLIIGTAVAFIFPLFTSTNVPYLTCVYIMMTALLPSCFNLGYSMKYRVVLLTDQKEYVVSAVSGIFYAVGTSFGVFVISRGYDILASRTIIMVFMFLSHYSIGAYCRRKYKFVQFKEKPLYDEITGAKNVLALKLTTMLYSSMPIIMISTLRKDGALLASVYAVYKSVISIVGNGIISITNAPRLGFGSLLAEG